MAIRQSKAFHMLQCSGLDIKSIKKVYVSITCIKSYFNYAESSKYLYCNNIIVCLLFLNSYNTKKAHYKL